MLKSISVLVISFDSMHLIVSHRKNIEHGDSNFGKTEIDERKQICRSSREYQLRVEVGQRRKCIVTRPSRYQTVALSVTREEVLDSPFECLVFRKRETGDAYSME